MAKQIGMVVDLQKCVGCGACAFACKAENNTQNRARGQTFNWADFEFKTEGKFPNTTFATIPVRCNHCSEPKCIDGCPEPKALYKTEEGITMYNYKLCIQCKKCLKECPYSSLDAEKEKVSYSVISWNEVGKPTQDFWKDKTEAIKGGTSSGAGTAEAAKSMPPNKHAYTFKDDRPTAKGQKSLGKGEIADVRKDGWVDKCHFCIHRVRNNQDPSCVVACPSKARTVGDVNDPESEISKLLKKYKPMVLKNNKGEFLKEGEKSTKPNMYYIRSYSPASRKA